jgi:hypothetical protein
MAFGWGVTMNWKMIVTQGPNRSEKRGTFNASTNPRALSWIGFTTCTRESEAQISLALEYGANTPS